MLLWLYLRHRKRPEPAPAMLDPLPRVTLQLPIFNEQYVAKRLIKACLEIDYPRELLDIQVLDDSADETIEISRQAVEAAQAAGHEARLFHRAKRTGYKAGALREALPEAKGEFIVVFDADFVPGRDFLHQVLPHFTDERVGMVQARWEHLNRERSLLTRIQAIMLDGHFVLEHTSRFWSGRLIHFNGTAGVLRRTCIDDAGGWHDDTLTEDLDLSYRAQLVGWKFVYLPHIAVLAELPVDMNGFKSQQHRWAKGTVQTAKKLLPRLLRSKLSFGQKLEGFFHLTNHFAYVFTFLITLLCLPAIFVKTLGHPLFILLVEVPVFLMATCSVFTFYAFSQRELGQRPASYLPILPLVLATGVGMALNSTVALMEGLLGDPGEFVRTPKHGEGSLDLGERRRRYRGRKGMVLLLEVGMAVYLFTCLIFAVAAGYYLSVPFIALFMTGFGFVAGLSLWHGR